MKFLKVIAHFFFQATVGHERHVACKLIRKDSAKCCFGLTIFSKVIYEMFHILIMAYLIFSKGDRII